MSLCTPENSAIYIYTKVIYYYYLLQRHRISGSDHLSSAQWAHLQNLLYPRLPLHHVLLKRHHCTLVGCGEANQHCDIPGPQRPCVGPGLLVRVDGSVEGV